LAFWFTTRTGSSKIDPVPPPVVRAPTLSTSPTIFPVVRFVVGTG
jgi:hypothetical protein